MTEKIIITDIKKQKIVDLRNELRAEWKNPLTVTIRHHELNGAIEVLNIILEKYI